MRLALLVLMPWMGTPADSPAAPVGATQDRACADCRTALRPDARFCTNCGRKVQEVAAPKKEPARPDRPAGQEPERVKEARGDELEKFGVKAEEINRAIDRGAAFLAAWYLKNDFKADEDYLAAYALVHTRQYRTSARLREKIAVFLKGSAWSQSNRRPYVVSLRALALEATRDPELKKRVRECAEYLIEAQGPQGTWSYASDVDLGIPAAAEQPPPEPAVLVTGGRPPGEAISPEALTRKGRCKDPRDGDNSCAQFGILGLHAAARCGFKVPDDAWEKCLEAIRGRALKDGGWGYDEGATESYGSMTCAGVSTIALCRSYLGKQDPLDDDKLKAGLAWLAGNFAVDRNPKSSRWPLYFLYSIERVGIFCGTETLGNHRWYPLGARRLVATQDPREGCWSTDDENQIVGTSFALLFLTRATAPLRAPARGGKGWLETCALSDSSNYMFILDASGSMREEIDGKEKFEIAREVVESIVRRLPRESHAGLRVYGHRRIALDPEADLDTELLIPYGPIDREEFLSRVGRLRCRGKTPLTLSLLEAAKDIAKADPGAEIVTILLTDGGESTRGAKPAVAAAGLAASRPGMKLVVVGFDINADDVRDQLVKTAAAGGGRYLPARKASDLLNALSVATVGEAAYLLRGPDGKEALLGRVGDRHEIPEGRYTFSLELGEKTGEETVVWINSGVTTHITVRESPR